MTKDVTILKSDMQRMLRDLEEISTSDTKTGGPATKRLRDVLKKFDANVKTVGSLRPDHKEASKIPLRTEEVNIISILRNIQFSSLFMIFCCNKIASGNERKG